MSVPQPTTLGLTPSFGFGDRIGLATPGHVAALRRTGSGIAPIFAQQSIREMTRTQRSPERVMGDAMEALAASDWSEPHGADADHLKTPDDVNRTAEAGFVFFTIDPSEHVDQGADDYAPDAVDEEFGQLGDAAAWAPEYLGQSVTLPGDLTVEFDEVSVKRAAVKYGPAIQAAIKLAGHIQEVQEAAGRPYEIELSVDETEQPTTLVEHYIIAEQCLKAGVKLVSLAPRFIGDFEKGVDYIGDVPALEASLRSHAAIAEHLGPYKLSLHSGSDKLAMYPSLARATGGRFHVKTAGTSYLEALRAVAIEAPDFFREIVAFGRARFEADKATYHVSASLDRTAAPNELTDDRRLQAVYLEHWDDVPEGRGFVEPGRQILHCTFGSVLTDDRLGPALKQCLQEHQATYTAVLEEHFSRHLAALSGAQ
ncbi:MAG: tagaturonate epimerase family protein [Planctomycetota bacterium]